MGVQITKKSFEIADPGLHNVRVIGVEDLGLVESTYNGVTSTKEKMIVKFEVLDQQDAAGNNIELWARMTKSVHEKSMFGKLLAVLNITPDDTFDTDDILGAALQVVAVHDKTGQYANVDTFIALKQPKAQPRTVAAHLARKQISTLPASRPQQTAVGPTQQTAVPANIQQTAVVSDEDINF